MSARSPVSALLAADRALAAYLGGLLAEGPSAAGPTPIPVAASVAPEGGSPAADAAAPVDNLPFDALLIDVRGLKLALRADRVERVAAWRSECLQPEARPRPGVMGTIEAGEGLLTICDTAALVIPQARGAAAAPRRLIVIREIRWALTCDAVAGMLTLTPPQVHWRTNTGRRPWLAGTVKEHGCALLDLEALPGLFGQGGRPDIGTETASKSASPTDFMKGRI